MPNNTKSYIKYYEIVFDDSARGGPGPTTHVVGLA